jgi:hypothetical protein
MAWSYCERWNKMLGKPIDPLTEEEARSRHDLGKLYVAYSRRDDGTVSTAVEVRLENGFVGIWNFDTYQRPAWRRVLMRHGDRMFMEDGYLYEYGDSTKLVTLNQAERFFHRHVDTDGTGYTVERRKGSTTEERTEISLKDDRTLDHYWTTAPAFGEYDEVTLAGIDPEELEQALRDSGLENS